MYTQLRSFYSNCLVFVKLESQIFCILFSSCVWAFQLKKHWVTCAWRNGGLSNGSCVRNSCHMRCNGSDWVLLPWAKIGVGMLSREFFFFFKIINDESFDPSCFINKFLMKTSWSTRKYPPELYVWKYKQKSPKILPSYKTSVPLQSARGEKIQKYIRRIGRILIPRVHRSCLHLLPHSRFVDWMLQNLLINCAA